MCRKLFQYNTCKTSRKEGSGKTGRTGHRILSYDGYEIYVGLAADCPPGIEPWISQFCRQNVWCVPIDTEWASDWFNQYGLNPLFPDFDLCIELMCDMRSSAWGKMTDEKAMVVHDQAVKIYGLLHARYICQPTGLKLMKAKYDQGIFGYCLRVYCSGTPLLPMGTTLAPRRHGVKLYCPKCCDVYRAPPDVVIDGAWFGPAFPHMFIYEYPEVDKRLEFEVFAPRAFGFAVRKPKNARYPVHEWNQWEDDNPEQPADE